MMGSAQAKRLLALEKKSLLEITGKLNRYQSPIRMAELRGHRRLVETRILEFEGYIVELDKRRQRRLLVAQRCREVEQRCYRFRWLVERAKIRRRWWRRYGRG